MLRVDLRTLLGLILPNQYCHAVVRKIEACFGYIISLVTPTPSIPLLYSTIVLYDITPLYLSTNCEAIVHKRWTMEFYRLSYYHNAIPDWYFIF